MLGAGLAAAEAVIREGMLRLGGKILGELLSADPGYRGSVVACGNGHEAVFAGYRGKTVDTVVGQVRLRRAWYHCAACKHGLAPRDAELGITGTSLSPGLAAMAATAGAAGRSPGPRDCCRSGPGSGLPSSGSSGPPRQRR